jgi:hypothetical protein
MKYALTRNVVCSSMMYLGALGLCAGAGGEEVKLIESFSDCIAKNGVPCGWRPTQNATDMFSIAHEKGECFLRVNTRCGNTTIGKRFCYQPRRFPSLMWRWRVHELPTGAREDRKQLNDSGAGVYVIFRGPLWLNRMIKYVWSTTLEAGTRTQSPYNSRVKVIVLRSGSDRLGEWITERVDVRRDYLRLFGEQPPEVEAIALMSDADNTESCARADYDDFRIGADGTARSTSRHGVYPLSRVSPRPVVVSIGVR